MSVLSKGYDTAFFDSIGGGSARSAQRIVPLVLEALHPTSVLDVGCGRGVWTAEFARLGVSDFCGVDGEYVTPKTLVIAPEHFLARNIAQRFELGRQYGLAVCLEVGEHIPLQTSATLVANLVAHAPMVLFSAAVPGQGGQDHINEMPPLEFWCGLFRAMGYVALDPFRPQVRGEREVEPWYRNNMLLYVRADLVGQLPAGVAVTLIPDGQAIADVSSPLFQLRKFVLRHLPRRVVTAMAQIKHTLRGSAWSAN